jgi:hypothetical protein
VIPHTTEADLSFEFCMPQHLATDRVSPCVGDDGLALLVDRNDARGEAGLELGLQFFRDRREDFDAGQEAIRCGSCVWQGLLSVAVEAGGGKETNAPTGDHLA